jgi:hypothetical protein
VKPSGAPTYFNKNYNAVNAWQENHVAMETVMQLAELRHQEVINTVTLATEQNHRTEVAQLTGEAIITLHSQTREHEDAQERLKRESVLQAEHIAGYTSATQTAESQQAQAAYADMQQRGHLTQKGIR